MLRRSVVVVSVLLHAAPPLGAQMSKLFENERLRLGRSHGRLAHLVVERAPQQIPTRVYGLVAP